MDYDERIENILDAIAYSEPGTAIRAALDYTGNEYAEWSSISELKEILREPVYQMTEEELYEFCVHCGIEY